MAKQEELVRDPWEWQSNPTVLVSKRLRRVQFPRALLAGEASAEQMAKWLAPECLSTDRNEVTLNILAGVTFLSTWTSAWALRSIGGASQAPKGAPAESAMVLVAPSSTSQEVKGFKDRETGLPHPANQHAAWLRAIAYLRARGKLLAEAGDFDMWTADDGAEGPEVQTLPLLDLLQRKTEAGRVAEAATLAAIPWCKDSGHLGALHDYAIRHSASAGIAIACRARALHFSALNM
mgnify:CR=1 FL=1